MALITGIFFHIAKTSGSSQKTIIDQYDNIKIDNTYFTNNACENYNQNIFKWTFVRHPLDRLASILGAWRWKNINKNMSQILDLVELGHLINWRIPTYDASIMLTDMYQNTDMAILSHLKPMHKLIDTLNKDNIKLNFIGRFENLHEDWAKISQKLNISNKLPHVNQSKHYPYQKYFTKRKILDKALSLYKQDFEYFNYHQGIKL